MRLMAIDTVRKYADGCVRKIVYHIEIFNALDIMWIKNFLT